MKNPMLGLLVSVMCLWALNRAVLAQAPAAGPSAQADRARMEQYVGVVKAELERGEARVKDLTAQLVSLDHDIEARVNRMVSLLSSVRDSTDKSSTRMRQAKDDALDGLKATAVYYAQERDARKKEMLKSESRLDDAELARNVAALNARIETRVTQSLAIASSLAQHEEGATEKYISTDTSYVETREHRKAEKDASASVKIKEDVVADLRASIEKLTRDVKAREAELRTATEPEKKEQLTKDIQTMRQTIEARKNQIEEVVTAPKSATRAVSSKAAFEMDKMLDEMTRELKSDFMKFRNLVAERDAALARVKPLKERMEKATAGLESTGASASKVDQ